MKDYQYKLLKIICKKSRGIDHVSYSEIKKAWKKCPEPNAILNLCKGAYLQSDYKDKEYYFFPNPEAFSYVRQCRDSFRNLIVTSATLLVAVWTLLATIFQRC